MLDTKEPLKIEVNKLIDTLISDWNFALMQRYFEGLKPTVKDKEDAVLGFFYGMICSALTDYLKQTKQEITLEDTNIVAEVFQNRLKEIKEKICKNIS